MPMLVQDLRSFLAQSKGDDLDLVVAAETLQYLGPLEGVFQDISRVLKVGGLFAFTVDSWDQSQQSGGDEDERGRRQRAVAQGKVRPSIHDMMR